MGSLLHSLTSDGSVPAVDANDLKAVWTLMDTSPAGAAGPPANLSASLIAQHCSPNANVAALFLRATLVRLLVQQSLLEPWREAAGLRQRVFDELAITPLSANLADVDVDALLARLKSS